MPAIQRSGTPTVAPYTRNDPAANTKIAPAKPDGEDPVADAALLGENVAKQLNAKKK